MPISNKYRRLAEDATVSAFDALSLVNDRRRSRALCGSTTGITIIAIEAPATSAIRCRAVPRAK
jgi:hypothetical protein